jgi:multidrug efflux pump subunit AcrA (membrane-fusion protein)
MTASPTVKTLTERLIALCAIAALCLAASSCSEKKGSDEPAAATGTPVSIVHPSMTTMTESVTFAASTSFLKKEIVRSTFTGFIRSVNASIGGRVAPGETLFQIATKDAAAADSARITVNGSPFAGAVAVKASTRGVLTELNFHPGDYVTDGEQLAVVSDPSSMVVLLNVPFEDASKIHSGARCTLMLPDGRRVPGVVSGSLPSVDQASQTQSFIIRSEAVLPANLNLTVSIPVREAPHAVALPKQSVQSNETLDEFWVMKLVNDSVAVKIPIEKGIETDSTVQIVSPRLMESERIVMEHGYGLPDTAKVIVRK